MGTWISHLRTAEKIQKELPELNCEWFYAGSIAPDCGLPNKTWTNFDPPKSVTHYIAAGDRNHTICDLNFFREYSHAIGPDLSSPETSFLWGYYFHLLTDRLWVECIDTATRALWANLFTEKGNDQAIELIKDDWYGLDHRFLRDNPGWQPWEIFSSLNIAHIPLHHISSKAVQFQFNYIRSYYNNQENHKDLDRPYPFLNEFTMQRIIDDTAAASLNFFNLLQSSTDFKDCISAIELLSPEIYKPYPPPLGDVLPL